MVAGAIIAAVPVKGSERPSMKRMALGSVVAASPDLDMLLVYAGVDYFAAHRTYTHSVISVFVVIAVLWALDFIVKNKKIAGLSIPYGLIGACLLVHVGLDMLGADYKGPQGLMLFWPLSDMFYYADIGIFPAIMDFRVNAKAFMPLLFIFIKEIIVIGLGVIGLFSVMCLYRKIYYSLICRAARRNSQFLTLFRRHKD